MKSYAVFVLISFLLIIIGFVLGKTHIPVGNQYGKYSPTEGGYSKLGAPIAPYSSYEYLVGKTVKFNMIAGEKGSIGVVKYANGFQVGVKCDDRERPHTAYGYEVEIIE